jgi:hypothetical protein
MKADQTTTRKQLQGYGATSYQAKALTQNLTPLGKQGRAHTYPVDEVIVSVREYLQRPRLKVVNQQKLEIVLQTLLERLGNVVEIPFGCSSNPEIGKLAKQLIQAVSKTNKSLAELKATAATIKGKYGV